MASALTTLRMLPPVERRRIQRMAVRLAHPRERRPRAWTDSDCAISDDHPALVKALREGWWQKATMRQVVKRLSVIRDVGYSHLLSILFFAEVVAPLVDDPPVAACRAHRISHLRESLSLRHDPTPGRFGDPIGYERSFFDGVHALLDTGLSTAPALFAAGCAVGSRLGDVAERAARACSSATRNAVSSPAFSVSWTPYLLELFPDPCRIDVRDALTRFDGVARIARVMTEEMVQKSSVTSNTEEG